MKENERWKHPSLARRRPGTWPVWLWVAVGSGAGGGGRILVAVGAIELFEAGFPYGILLVNVMGSFLIGVIAVLPGPEGKWTISPAVRQGLMVGFCGGFTTFSFFSLQTFQLLQQKMWMMTLAYTMATVILSLVFVWLGFIAGKRISWK